MGRACSMNGAKRNAHMTLVESQKEQDQDIGGCILLPSVCCSSLLFIFVSPLFCEDKTTCYWREQQARGKSQIAEETEHWANEYRK
jgi:hypothetical protein